MISLLAKKNMIHANYRTLSRTEESYRTIIVLDRETTDRKPIVVLLFSNVTFIASREKKNGGRKRMSQDTTISLFPSIVQY